MAKSLPFPNEGGPASTLRESLRATSQNIALRTWGVWVSLAGVIVLALAINGLGLSKTGLGNTYYAAAARSMTMDWKNFFFGAFDPGGFITVDKPPVFLWVEALSARIFGYSGLAILLPSAVAGAVSVGLIWVLVRRSFGAAAATLSAVALALTPIWVAVHRLNLPEPFYLLSLIGAAGAIIMSFDRRRWWLWTAAAGVLVGVAFNSKMLSAWIPGPALAIAIVAGVPVTWRTAAKRWLPRLAILGVSTLIASASWMIVVDLWPASARPFIGGSTDNTVSNLVIGYNGIGRLEGEGQGGPNRGAPNRQGGAQIPGPGGAPFPGQPGGFVNPNGGQPQAPGQSQGGGFAPPGGGAINPNGGSQGAPPNQGLAPQQGGTVNQNRNFRRPQGNGQPQTPGVAPQNGGFGGQSGPPSQFPGQVQNPGAPPQQGPGAQPFGPGGGAPGGFQGPGGIIAGRPSVLRMFDAANGTQIAWLLPFALLGGLLSLWRWRRDPSRRGTIVLWLGWVVMFGGVFSYTQGIYHSYYTSALAPGIAALVGIATVASTDLIRRHSWWIIAAIGIAAATLAVQWTISGRMPDFFGWLRPIAVAAALTGAAVLVVSLRAKLTPMLGIAAIVVALILIPGVWSGYETANASLNTTLPQAGPRQGAAGRTFGSNAFDNGTTELAAWLHAHSSPDARWDLAVTSAMNASTLIADHQLSVMALGGFMGRDPTITVQQFGEFVANGDVRYVLTTGGFGGGPGRGGQRTPFGAGQGISGQNGSQQAMTFSTEPGANAVISAARAVCTPVTDSSLPAQYRGGLYDCAGMEGRLMAP